MSRIKIIGFMAVVMLILLMTTGFCSIAIDVSACSAIGIMYGYKYKDRIFVRWSTVTLVIGISSIIYTLILIKSM